MFDIRDSLEEALLSALEKRDASGELNAVSHDLSEPDHSGSTIGAERLLQLVQSELVPRLLMAHRSDPFVALSQTLCSTADGDAPVSERVTTLTRQPMVRWDEEDFRYLGDLCVLGDAVGIRRIVGSFLDKGIALDRIYLDFVAPTARWLGDRWVDDSLSFVDVHLGLVQLHQLVSYYEVAQVSSAATNEGRKILLACTPGDQHTFGITLVSDFFRRAGWQVSNRSGQTLDQLAAHVASTRFSCIGLSLYCDDHIANLNRSIARLRRCSANSDALVIVGGNYFMGRSPVRCPVEADMFVVDAGDAVERVSALLDTRVAARTARSQGVARKENSR